MLNLDTGDVIYNAFLTPVFYYLSSDSRKMYVNYSGDNQLMIIIENRLINIFLAFFKPIKT